LLDIFGFENFQTNSFEQLCINFTNEKLHQLYIHQIFKIELETYKTERLEHIFGQIGFEDNQPLIDLVEKAPNGLFAILDDISSLGSGTDEQYLQKLVQTHAKTSLFITNKFAKQNFTIVHTSAPVEYCSLGFRGKNKDETSPQVFELLRGSSSTLVSRLLETAENS
jgi:myosin heavy subunit